jgi:hypothetical protein
VVDVVAHALVPCRRAAASIVAEGAVPGGAYYSGGCLGGCHVRSHGGGVRDGRGEHRSRGGHEEHGVPHLALFLGQTVLWFVADARGSVRVAGTHPAAVLVLRVGVADLSGQQLSAVVPHRALVRRPVIVGVVALTASNSANHSAHATIVAVGAIPGDTLERPSGSGHLCGNHHSGRGGGSNRSGNGGGGSNRSGNGGGRSDGRSDGDGGCRCHGSHGRVESGTNGGHRGAGGESGHSRGGATGAARGAGGAVRGLFGGTRRAVGHCAGGC